MTIHEKSVDAIRILSAEMISRAKSGHPGICFGASPIVYSLYSDIMNYNPADPAWENRDRFVLSAGHGSAMLYAALSLFGFGLKKEDLMSFRQLGSKTPGHPEWGVTPGVEVSTGPLGQGVANAVGLALAEAHLAAIFNREGFPVVDHYTYALCGEGCLEEGISYEACSFAGTQKLGKLILFYDCNHISIEGNTDDAFGDNVAARFSSQGWQVLEVADANDLSAILAAAKQAKADAERPSLIICHSQIGYGTPVSGSAKAHGTPLSEDELRRTKEFFNWNEHPFEVSSAVRYNCAEIAKSHAAAEEEWKKMFASYCEKYPELAALYARYFENSPADMSDLFEKLRTEKPEASRISGGVVINEAAAVYPNLLSGSADLSPSTKTNLTGEKWFSPECRTGRNIHFGIREHAMAAICNGIALHGGLKIICSTFFVFSDYMKGAMRMSAIMGLPVIYVLTHDSIGVGEDGPTHQPIEQLAALRAMPSINVFRPCDRSETVAAFISAFSEKRPTVIVLTRQNLEQYNCGENAFKGAYVLGNYNKNAKVALIASGSEVQICVAAQKLLAKNSVESNVISVPCTQLFDRQKESYKKSLLSAEKRLCVEASSDNIWYRYAPDVLEMTTFGESGPMEKLYEKFGFTAENIAERVMKDL